MGRTTSGIQIPNHRNPVIWGQTYLREIDWWWICDDLQKRNRIIWHLTERNRIIIIFSYNGKACIGKRNRISIIDMRLSQELLWEKVRQRSRIIITGTISHHFILLLSASLSFSLLLTTSHCFLPVLTSSYSSGIFLSILKYKKLL